PALLPRLGLLALPLDRRLLVVRALLHLLEEPIFQHELLHGLERGLHLIVVYLDTHDRQSTRRAGRCQCQRGHPRSPTHRMVRLPSMIAPPARLELALAPTPILKLD